MSGRPSGWRNPRDRRTRSQLTRLVVARPRTWLALLVGATVGTLLPGEAGTATRILIAWVCGSLFYVGSVLVMMARSDIGDIRRRAALNDENRYVILAVLVASALASLVAVVLELADHDASHWLGTPARLALAGATVALSWVVTHLVFTMHYAHVYYGEGEDGDRGGLKIPGDEEEPTYGDFLYFSFVIGCATATADINITTREMRRVAMLHGIIAFAFNTAVLALSINIGASLLQGPS